VRRWAAVGLSLREIDPGLGDVRLFANLFRPTADGRYPVIMSVTPYGKDKLPDRVANFFMRLSGVKFGTSVAHG